MPASFEQVEHTDLVDLRYRVGRAARRIDQIRATSGDPDGRLGEIRQILTGVAGGSLTAAVPEWVQAPYVQVQRGGTRVLLRRLPGVDDDPVWEVAGFEHVRLTRAQVAAAAPQAVWTLDADEGLGV